jgi:SpoVK/Ycf46/Vps4 family AAA+-type ATPase
MVGFGQNPTMIFFVGMTLQSARDSLRIAMTTHLRFDAETIVFLRAEQRKKIEESGLLKIIHANPVELGGMKALSSYISRTARALSPEARSVGIKPPRGLILVGPPGTGKSQVAKMMAHRLGATLVQLDMAALLGSLVGQSEQRTQAALALLDEISKTQPVVLWGDEIEKALAGANADGRNDGGVLRRVFGFVLTWMEERTHSGNLHPVYMVMTSNGIEMLPPEFVQRFDAVFFIDFPNDEERREILRIHLSPVKHGKVSIEEVAQACAGFTGREIEWTIQQALQEAFMNDRKMTTSDLLDACAKSRPISVTRSRQMAELTRWAEQNAIHASGEYSPTSPNTGSTWEAL